MIASFRACLCGALVFVAGCGDPQNRANVPDEPRSADGTAVIVLGGPTARQPQANEKLAAAPEEPAAVAKQAAPPTTTMDADLATLVRDPRKSRWAPQPTPQLITKLQLLESLHSSMPRNAADRPAVLRRLAEDYIELKHAARRDKERLLSSSGPSNAGRPQATNEIAKLDNLITSAQTIAFKYYMILVHTYPNYCQSPHPTDPAQSHGCLDEPLYALALEYQEVDRLDEARKHYFNIIKNFPQSKWVAYAYLAFGELFLAEGMADPSKLDIAQKSYEEVLKASSPQNDAFGFAHYRLAQIHHQKQDEANALAHYVHAIDFSLKFAGFPSSKPLGDAARREIIPSYAAGGIPRKAEAFFTRLTNDPPGTNEQVVAMLNDLIGIYLRVNKRVEANDVCYAFSGGPGAITTCGSIARSALQPKP